MRAVRELVGVQAALRAGAREVPEAGLLDGSRLIVDATHVEANAALKSLRASCRVIDGDEEAGTRG